VSRPSIMYSAALQSSRTGNDDESEEGKGIVDQEAPVALKTTTTKLANLCLKTADDMKDNVLHSGEMTARGNDGQLYEA
jgi:hypothetical protein